MQEFCIVSSTSRAFIKSIIIFFNEMLFSSTNIEKCIKIWHFPGIGFVVKISHAGIMIQKTLFRISAFAGVGGGDKGTFT